MDGCDGMRECYIILQSLNFDLYYVIIALRLVHVLFIFVVSLKPGALSVCSYPEKKTETKKQQQGIFHGLGIKPCLVI